MLSEHGAKNKLISNCSIQNRNSEQKNSKTHGSAFFKKVKNKNADWMFLREKTVSSILVDNEYVLTVIDREKGANERAKKNELN